MDNELIIVGGNVSINNGGDTTEVLMSPSGYIAAAVTLFLIGFFGFFLNLTIIVLMCKDKQLWTPMNVILFNLVLTDFSVSIFGNPLTFLSAVYCGWMFGPALCTAYGFFMALLGIVSITTLTALAFERYLMVSLPFRNRHLKYADSAYVLIGIWIYALIVTAPPLFGWGEYVEEAAKISCSVNWESRSYNATTYIIYLFMFGLVIPLIVIVFSYGNVVRTMKKNNFRMGSVAKAEQKVTYMVLLMIMAFLTAWTPYAVFALIAQFGDYSIMTPSMGVVPALVAKSSICYNPVIYVGLNTQFRQSLKRLHTIRKPNSTCETYAVGISRVMSRSRSTHSPKQVLEGSSNGRNPQVNLLLTRRNSVGASAEEYVLIVKKIDNNSKSDSRMVDV